jgi:peptidoglycan/xylan/chitin deacetylase (PgdA/CDA1 family)
LAEDLFQVEIPERCAPATEDELRAALVHPGITVGSHTWSHPNLTGLHTPELERELTRPLHWLCRHFDRFIPWLSYPYGLSSPTVQEAVAGAGYQAALRISGGWVPRGPCHPLQLPRLNVPTGLSSGGFRVRIAGFFCR